MVRAMNVPVVKGNHDEMCSIEEDMEGFNPHAAEAGANGAGQVRDSTAGSASTYAVQERILPTRMVGQTMATRCVVPHAAWAGRAW